MSGRGTIRIVVLGGGTAGWMSASALAKLLGPLVSVTLIESEDIGIVGVGEATLPHIRGFVERLGIDEAAFMRATHATYKLGIDLHDFGRIGERRTEEHTSELQSLMRILYAVCCWKKKRS